MKIFILLLLSFSTSLLSKSIDESSPIKKIAFGSCSKQDKPQPIWNAINQENPDLFIFLGDNIYGDTENVEELREKYRLLGKKPGLKDLWKKTPIIATWDDHDYGVNDGGKEFPQKEAFKREFLTFFKEPRKSPRWNQEGGIYTSYMIGPKEKRVHIILLDTRWDRDPLTGVPPEQAEERLSKNMGPYLPNENPKFRMLGNRQWGWLKIELKRKSMVKIIGSSIQFLSHFTGWESWSNFPKEKERLIKLIQLYKIPGVFFISGDTHWSEFSKYQKNTSYPLWELTSSGLTESWKEVSPNIHRDGPFYVGANFGLIEFDWKRQNPSIQFSIKGEEGQLILQKVISLNSLTPKK